MRVISEPSSVVAKAAVAELIGTALLLATVVGSGIAGERLSGGNVALALLANSLATGGALFALIFTFAPLSGAHFNPVVSLAAVLEGAMTTRRALLYVVAQVIGAVFGVLIAHAMFAAPLLQTSTHHRSGLALWISEVVATFGLVMVIHGTKSRAAVVPLTVAGYVTAGYWFTSSTCFANPAVTIARTLTDTFAGIFPGDALPFIAAQLIGAIGATYLFRWMASAKESL